MSKDYLVSVCVPIYNVEKYIEKCAVSLFEQTYNNLEFIFVNDSTPDNSISILKNLIPRYPHRKECIKIINHETNKGLSAARNSAICHSSGDFIIHVDSDDFIEKETIYLLVKEQVKSQSDIVSCHRIKHTKKGTLNYNEPKYSNRDAMLLYILSHSDRHEIWGRLIRKQLYTNNNIKAIEGIDVGEDWQVLTQLVFFCNKIALVDSYLYHYNCMNDNSYLALKNKTIINEKIAKQDIKSMMIVYNFFYNKEKKFKDAITKTGLYICHLFMDKCIITKNQSLFYFISDSLNTNKDSFSRNWWHRIVDNSYYLYKFIYYLHFFKSGIDCRIKRLSSYK